MQLACHASPMTTTAARKPCATASQLRQWFDARIKAQTPAARITWTMPLRSITFPTGMRGIVGEAEVSAPGYAPRRMIVTADPFGRSAR